MIVAATIGGLIGAAFIVLAMVIFCWRIVWPAIQPLVQSTATIRDAMRRQGEITSQLVRELAEIEHRMARIEGHLGNMQDSSGRRYGDQPKAVDDQPISEN